MTSNKFISLSTQTITLKFYYICYIMYLLHSCFTLFGIAPEKEIPQPLPVLCHHHSKVSSHIQLDLLVLQVPIASHPVTGHN